MKPQVQKRRLLKLAEFLEKPSRKRNMENATPKDVARLIRNFVKKIVDPKIAA